MRVIPFTLVILAASAAFAQPGPFNNEPYAPLSAGDKAKLHLNRIYSPSGLLRSSVSAGWNQWDNDPPEWGQGMLGYGRRYGHRLLNRAVENTIGMGVVTSLGEDPRYFYSGEQGVLRRVKYAVWNTLTTRTDDGGRRFSTWRFAGNYGASIISNSWRPASENTLRDAMQRGTLSIGFDMAGNIFKEFWPDIRRKVFKRPR
jgi:hypothetical protein